MKKLIRKATRKTNSRGRIGQIRRSTIAGASGARDLERESDRLKDEYPSAFHARIDEDIEWVRRDMGVVPGSVSVQDAMLALSDGLPTLSRRAPARKRIGSGK